MRDKLLHLITEEKLTLKSMENELKTLPIGNLYVRVKGNSTYYTRYVNGHQHGITRDTDLIHKLARRAYLEDYIKQQKQILALLNAASEVKSSLDLKKFHMLNEDNVVYSAKVRKWLKNNRSQNPYKPEHLKYSTKNGVLVRSKSERYIGNFLEEHNIPYLYEAPVNLNGRIYYPDFVIMKADGTIILWEHFGLMEDPEYIQRTYIKLEEYRKAGYVQHSNLICTYEEDLLDLGVLEDILYRFVL